MWWRKPFYLQRRLHCREMWHVWRVLWFVDHFPLAKISGWCFIKLYSVQNSFQKHCGFWNETYLLHASPPKRWSGKYTTCIMSQFLNLVWVRRRAFLIKVQSTIQRKGNYSCSMNKDFRRGETMRIFFAIPSLLANRTFTLAWVFWFRLWSLLI